MTKTPKNYQNMVIYKIVCKDLTIIDLYVGSTTCFVKRKYCHKSDCEKSKLKIYQTIRENGGWENWDMIEIEKYPCNDGNEARARERYWYEELNPSLNIYSPLTTIEEAKIQKKICHQKNNELEKVQKKIWYEENIEKSKQITKEWRDKNKEKEKLKKKEWYEANKEKIKQKRMDKKSI